MRLWEVVETSAAVTRTTSRLEKVGLLAALLSRTPAEAIEVVVGALSGEIRQGRIGVGAALLSSMREIPPAAEAELDVCEVDASFDRLAAATGPGSAETRAERLGQLFGRATREEQDFLARLLLGELRQGALEGVLVDAVAKAAGVASSRVRRAAMLAGDLATVARAAIVEGENALTTFTLQLFKPVQPMLADTAADVADALSGLGEASLEYKLDGARIQVHKADDEVRVYSRNLRDVTTAVPEVVSIVRALPARSVVLDGEVIAMRQNGSPEPFQVTMRRFGRKIDVDGLRASLPLSPYFFDVLYRDGDVVIDEPLTHRLSILADLVRPANSVPRLVTASPSDAEAFVRRALAIGHEGVMAKALEAPYAAGRRGSAWLKIKQARTLDLAILAAEWGSGRRKGTLSNLHLGARDTERGGFVMLGKTFKGLTDEMLAWQTKHFLELEIARDRYVIYVRPEVIAEIAFNDVQASSQYAGGLTLRFARVKRYRPDKAAADADTFASVQAIYRQTTGLPAPVR
jgi:DNA ligase-1